MLSASRNCAYVPVEVDEEEFGLTRDQLYLKLREYNVFARRYFYPLVPDFACYRGVVAARELPVARRVASRAIHLPRPTIHVAPSSLFHARIQYSDS